jgi:isoquinoline 1-oxidoreductase beta subunit
MTHMELTRRSFVVTAAAAGGGLMLGVSTARSAAINPTPWMAATSKDGTEISHWIVIDPDGLITVRVGQQEMGQGAFTSMPMLVNEELHADWTMIRAEYADANRHVRNDKLYKRMGTAGSGGVRRSRVYLQEAGASVRERLKAAAAAAWGVDASTVAAKDSVLTSGNNSGTYAEFASAAASIALAEEPAIKTPDQYQLLGTSIARLDTPLKVNGSAEFGIDARIPGMAYAAVMACPVPGGKFLAGRRLPDPFDASTIMDRPGVIQVVQIDRVPGKEANNDLLDSVAVVADTYYQAKTALELLAVNWNYGTGVHVSTAGLFAQADARLGQPGRVTGSEGDAMGILSTAANAITSTYQRPYEGHAMMEPENATVSIAEGRVDAYVGSQNPPGVISTIADQLGIDPVTVYAHNYFLGDGFGRRYLFDNVRQAAEIARQVGRPVKMVWSRDEDTLQCKQRPMGGIRFSASLGADGLPEAWFSRTYGSGRVVTDMRYAVPNRHHEEHNINSNIPTFAHRAPGAGVNGFMLESFADEVALAGGWDPLEWRLALTQDKADWQLVLNTMKAKSGFTTDLPKGEGMGIAIVESHGTICGMCATVTVSRRGQLRVEKVTVALDPGHIINPLNVTMQGESGVAFELSHAWIGGLDIKGGQVANSNFDNYHLLRIENMPEVETILALSGGEKWGGCGEPTVPPLGGAVANAVFFATGKRMYSTPFKNHDLSWS